MGNEIQFGIRITADGGVAIGEVKATREELIRLNEALPKVFTSNRQLREETEKLVGAQVNLGTGTSKLASEYANFAAEERKAASAARMAGDEYVKLDSALAGLLSRIDPVYASTRKLDSGSELLHQGLKAGMLTQAQYQSALANLGAQYGIAAEGAEKSAFATAGARRELIVLGHEALTGNFSRMPGSFMVLAERMGGVAGMVSPLTAGLVGAGALIAGGVIAWQKWGDHANEAIQRVIDGIDKSKKSLEDFQKEFDKMQRVELGASIDSLELQKSMLQKRQQELLGKDGGLKGTLNIFNPLGPKKEYDDLASKMSLIDRQIGLANASMQGLVEHGGKDLQKFLENTSYMDKAQQKLHELSKAGAEFRDAYIAASDDSQRGVALGRFRQAEKNINEKYRDKKSDRIVDQEKNAFAQVSGEINKYADSLIQADEAGAKLTHGQELTLGIMERIAHGTLKLTEVDKQRLASQLESMLGEEKVLAQKKEALALQEHWDKVMAESVDREIEQANAAAAAEHAAADVREKAYADMSARLQTENEDLNVALIVSDSARAKSQLELEHQRALDRINGLILESDQAQELIAQETENYKLRLKKIDSGLSDTRKFAKDLGLTFSSAFENAIAGGKKFSDVLRSLEQDIEKLLVRRTITEPLLKGVDSLISASGDFFSSLIPNAQGNAFAGAGLGAYSNSIVSRPTLFPFAHGIGLMGEKSGSPGEAIMPLTRMAGGDLGVKVEGAGGGVHLTVNLIESPSAGGQVQQRSDGNGNLTLDIMVEKIESTMGRRIQRGDGLAPTLESRYGLNGVAGKV